MDVRLTWADCDEAGDYVVPNVLSPSLQTCQDGRNKIRNKYNNSVNTILKPQ